MGFIYNMAMLMQWEMTALMYAATQGDETIFDVLMKHKADVIKKNRVSFI